MVSQLQDNATSWGVVFVMMLGLSFAVNTSYQLATLNSPQVSSASSLTESSISNKQIITYQGRLTVPGSAFIHLPSVASAHPPVAAHPSGEILSSGEPLQAIWLLGSPNPSFAVTCLLSNATPVQIVDAVRDDNEYLIRWGEDGIIVRYYLLVQLQDRTCQGWISDPFVSLQRP